MKHFLRLDAIEKESRLHAIGIESRLDARNVSNWTRFQTEPQLDAVGKQSRLDAFELIFKILKIITQSVSGLI